MSAAPSPSAGAASADPPARWGFPVSFQTDRVGGNVHWNDFENGTIVSHDAGVYAGATAVTNLELSFSKFSSSMGDGGPFRVNAAIANGPLQFFSKQYDWAIRRLT